LTGTVPGRAFLRKTEKDGCYAITEKTTLAYARQKTAHALEADRSQSVGVSAVFQSADAAPRLPELRVLS
jgi:hypothetical protein